MTQEEIKLKPHKMVDGVAILLTEQEIADLNRVDPSERKNAFLQAKDLKLAQCLDYLKSTDWQIIRSVDPSSTKVLGEGVAQKRALARSLQDDIKACTTLEELNAININFD